jgi:hypothetical protein
MVREPDPGLTPESGQPSRSGRSVNRLLDRPLPVPPASLRRGPFRRKAFTSRLRSPWLTARLGTALGLAVGICFVTGLLSHAIQHPPHWFWWPARPVALYRVTQGLHVATGLASIPLLGAKLWSVYPRLFAWPPARDVLQALERLSIALLTGAALFQLTTGVLNISYWYAAMPFAFIASHFWGAWLLIGALLVHLAVKLPIIRGALRRRPSRTPSSPGPAGGLSRRTVLTGVGLTVGVVTVATVGQTVRPLKTLSVLAPRVPNIGPQGLPVNLSAQAAGFATMATGADYRLVVTGPAGRLELTLAELGALPQVTVHLPITCVEGWSAGAVWTGVRVSELLGRVGASGWSASVTSMQAGGAYRSSVLDRQHAADPLTVLAMRLGDEPLHPDHGYPLRLIAPNRPGVMQTKWVGILTGIAPP